MQTKIIFTYKICLWETGVQNWLNNWHISAATDTEIIILKIFDLLLLLLKYNRFNLKSQSSENIYQ